MAVFNAAVSPFFFNEDSEQPWDLDPTAYLPLPYMIFTCITMKWALPLLILIQFCQKCDLKHFIKHSNCNAVRWHLKDQTYRVEPIGHSRLMCACPLPSPVSKLYFLGQSSPAFPDWWPGMGETGGMILSKGQAHARGCRCPSFVRVELPAPVTHASGAVCTCMHACWPATHTARLRIGHGPELGCDWQVGDLCSRAILFWTAW